MCKSISNDIIIGNFIIEAIDKNVQDVSFEKLILFDEEITKSLKKLDYSTKFSISGIFDFQNNYPFFVSSINNEHLNIVNFGDEGSDFKNKLLRHFRIGLPKSIVDELAEISKSVLED